MGKKVPEVGEYLRGTGKLIAVEEVPPKPEEVVKDFIFEEITAHCELRIGAEVIKEIVNYWDFYGRETSVESAIKTAQEYAANRGIGPNSPMEVVVIKVTVQRRKRLKPHAENKYANEYFDFASLEWGDQHGLPPAVKEVVWYSSKITK